jgi:hypothetical protein
MQQLRDRLLSRMVKVPGPLETECWIFQTRTGHALLRWGDQVGRASRFSYLAFVGPIKEGYHVCHRCDRPSCVNPQHLFQGSHRDNMQDAIAKGRNERPNTKLTEDDVAVIKRLLLEGWRQRDIAIEFDVSWSAISDINKGCTWSSINPKAKSEIPPHLIDPLLLLNHHQLSHSIGGYEMGTNPSELTDEQIEAELAALSLREPGWETEARKFRLQSELRFRKNGGGSHEQR